MDLADKYLQDAKDGIAQTQNDINRIEAELKAKQRDTDLNPTPPQEATDAQVTAQQDEITFLQEVIGQKDKIIENLTGALTHQVEVTKQKDESHEPKHKALADDKVRLNSTMLIQGEGVGSKESQDCQTQWRS
jgi:hypothetical protein